MVTHICDRCHHIFNRKSVYDRHINRKFKCKIVELNKNTLEEQLEKNGQDSVLDLLLLELKKVKKECNEISQQNMKLEKDNKKLLKHLNETVNGNNGNMIVSNGNNGTIMNVNVNLVAFGKEKMNFSMDDIAKLCQGNKTVPNMINHVHFNEDIPENHNVYMPSRKNRKEVFVYDGEEWMLANKKDVVEQLVDKGIMYIEGKMNELQNKLSASKLNAVQRSINIFNDENHENNKEITKKITEEVELILYNKKNVIMGTKNNKSIYDII